MPLDSFFVCIVLINQRFCREKEQLIAKLPQAMKGAQFQELSSELFPHHTIVSIRMVRLSLKEKSILFSFSHLFALFALTCKYGFCTSAPSEHTEEHSLLPPPSIRQQPTNNKSQIPAFSSSCSLLCFHSSFPPTPTLSEDKSLQLGGRNGVRGLGENGEESRDKRYFKEQLPVMEHVCKKSQLMQKVLVQT